MMWTQISVMRCTLTASVILGGLSTSLIVGTHLCDLELEIISIWVGQVIITKQIIKIQTCEKSKAVAAKTAVDKLTSIIISPIEWIDI